jgi:valyl-tRNA synthetase
MIDQYGADALRMTLASLTIQANYIRLSKEKIETFRNFTNKIWNVARFSLTHLEGFNPEGVKKEDLEYSLFDEWILYQLNNTIKKVTDSLNNFKFSDAAMTIYEFSWNYFCDWYVELIKETLYSKNNTEKRKTAQYVLWFVLDNILRLLHPFMPFITEEIWQKIPHEELSISISSWPEYKKEKVNKALQEKVFTIQEVIKTIRNIKAEMNIPLTKEVDVFINVVNSEKEELIKRHLSFIKNLAHASSFQVDSSLQKPKCSATGVLEDIEIFVPLTGVVDLEAEIKRLEKKLQKVEKDMIVINKKLNNSDFIQKAPVNIIEKEKEKIKELTDIRDRIQKNLKALKSV